MDRISHAPLPERPSGIRLMRDASVRGAPPPSPLGLGGWSGDDAEAVAVELAPLRGTEREKAARIASALPAPASLPAGTVVFVLGEARASEGFVMRLLKRDREPVSRAARATALAARGFVSVAAAFDEASGQDLVWGVTPATASV